MLTDHQWSPATFILGQFHKRYLNHQSLSFKFPRGQWVISLRGWVTHICVSRLTNIGSDNGLSPGRRQAIIWTIAGILLIGPLGTNFSEILSEFKHFLSRKCIWKWRLQNGVHLSRPQWVKSCMFIVFTCLCCQVADVGGGYSAAVDGTHQESEDYPRIAQYRKVGTTASINTLRRGDKMAAISQTIFSNASPWMKTFEFQMIFHWNVFLMV